VRLIFFTISANLVFEAKELGDHGTFRGLPRPAGDDGIITWIALRGTSPTPKTNLDWIFSSTQAVMKIRISVF